MGVGVPAESPKHRQRVFGGQCRRAPSNNQIQLLTILAQQTGAALAHAAMHDRDFGDAAKLTKSNADLKVANADLKVANRALGTTVTRLQRQTNVHEVLSTALAAGMGEQGIADALNDLTGHSVGIEDRFGNLRCWAGPGQPHPYPKQLTDERELLLHELAAQTGQARIRGRVLTLVQPRAEILGVLALNDPDDTVTEDDLLALRYGSVVLALELAHQRTVAEIELNLRRDLVDDLLAGTDRDGAYARADALGHDLRRPHHVVVMQTTGRTESTLTIAARRAATALHLNYLLGRHAGLVVLLTDGRPDPRALHHAISEILGRTTSVIGMALDARCPTIFRNPSSKRGAPCASGCAQSVHKAQRRSTNSVSIASSTPPMAAARSKVSCANGWAHSWITTPARTPNW